MIPEEIRLQEEQRREKNWKRWGPYLSERQWGTVREDYSPNGACWDYLPHDHARSRAYRWGEDGLLGITDREGRLCFSVALWNGKDSILKERLFGLSGPEGNHGEDVKELYFYLNSTPTHSYMQALYKYPQMAFPYTRLVEESRHRGKNQPEFELSDTGAFDENRYFDVFAEYAKAGPDDIIINLKIANRGPDANTIYVLPTLWFRNTWSWGRHGEGYWPKPKITLASDMLAVAEHSTFGKFMFAADLGAAGEKPTAIFTENETNQQRLFGSINPSPYVKDAFHEFIINGNEKAINPNKIGTKMALVYKLEMAAGQEQSVRLRLTAESDYSIAPFGQDFDDVIAIRKQEALQFYSERFPYVTDADERLVLQQSYAGLLWSKQFYYYSVADWLEGDPSQPKPAASRLGVRNSEWVNLYNRDVISMPDKWEYPWYAAWDLAFHMIPLSKVDPEFTKSQLLLFLREWYMHPNGQIPAYEFAFGDVNPPVHAWACWRVYKMTAPQGQRDKVFLARCFHKLLLNFTWWVNRKDPDGKNLFSGGFLGLDNIGVFDRSRPLPSGGYLNQADGTAWMAFYCATMLSMALELAREDPSYEDVASKFFEHFVSITDAINSLGGTGLWDQRDGFYYDQLLIKGETIPLRIRSMVGIIPLFAVEVLEDESIDHLHGFRKRMEWFMANRQDLAKYISYMEHSGGEGSGHRLLAVPSRGRLQRVLNYVLNEEEFLSPYGVRSLSKIHKEHPFVFQMDGQEYRVDYVPAESNTGLFGGNSNWRGPVWFPLNFILFEALERYHHFYGDSFQVECPSGSGNLMNLKQVATELASRMAKLFLKDGVGRRPCHGDEKRFQEDPHFRDLVLFYEYFHGDNGRGVGASHQTGWTSLVSRFIETLAKKKLRDSHS